MMATKLPLRQNVSLVLSRIDSPRVFLRNGGGLFRIFHSYSCHIIDAGLDNDVTPPKQIEKHQRKYTLEPFLFKYRCLNLPDGQKPIRTVQGLGMKNANKRFHSSIAPSSKSESAKDLLKASIKSANNESESKEDANISENDKQNQSLRAKLSSYRDDAREALQDFRDSPRESARAGAKSIGGIIKQYGPVFILTYGSVYLATLGSIFTGVESGVLDPVNLITMLGHGDATTANTTAQLVLELMNEYTFSKPYTYIVEQYPSVANFAVSWVVVKFTEPIRLPIAMYLTPRVARFLGLGNPPTTNTTTNSSTIDSCKDSASGSRSNATSPESTNSKST